jgi:hypothetical protein
VRQGKGYHERDFNNGSRRMFTAIGSYKEAAAHRDVYIFVDAPGAVVISTVLADSAWPVVAYGAAGDTGSQSDIERQRNR